MQIKVSQKENVKRWALRIALVLFDVFAVNFSYYFALVLRFYVNHQFHPNWAVYFPAFYRFAPFYTVCCIAVFGFFKLYNGMWKYAGWNDINRILFASIVTCAIQVFGTLLFVLRMPITYYTIGACIQFALILGSRFSYRVAMIELAKYARGKDVAAVRVMIVGAGENAKSVLTQFNNAKGSLARPVCVLDCHNRSAGRLFDGLPVVGGVDQIVDAAKKYQVNSVVLADALMPEELRAEVRAICSEQGLEVQDFFPFTQSSGKKIPLRNLLECVNGPLALLINGQLRRFENSEQAAEAFSGKYHVKSVSAGEELLIEVENDLTILNNMNEAWVRDYESETGESVSFF